MYFLLTDQPDYVEIHLLQFPRPILKSCAGAWLYGKISWEYLIFTPHIHMVFYKEKRNIFSLYFLQTIKDKLPLVSNNQQTNTMHDSDTHIG